MKLRRSNERPAVPLQAATLAEVQHGAMDVGDHATGLLGDQRSRGVIPDALDVAGVVRCTHVEIRGTPSHERILDLTVDADRLDAQTRALGELLRRVLS